MSFLLIFVLPDEPVSKLGVPEIWSFNTKDKANEDRRAQAHLLRRTGPVPRSPHPSPTHYYPGVHSDEARLGASLYLHSSTLETNFITIIRL